MILLLQVQQYKAQLPSVNYITAMDIWLFVCIFVVFSTLLEFAVCYNAHITCKEQRMAKVNGLTFRQIKFPQQMPRYYASE